MMTLANMLNKWPLPAGRDFGWKMKPLESAKTSFTTGKLPTRDTHPVGNHTAERELDFPLNFLVNTMPKEADLEAIYSYLRSLTPIDHYVNRYEKKK